MDVYGDNGNIIAEGDSTGIAFLYGRSITGKEEG